MVSVPTREIRIQAMKTLAEADSRQESPSPTQSPRRRACGARELRVTLGSGRRPITVLTENADVDDERPPICPACGVTMVPAALSAREAPAGDWICLECEETSKSD